MLQGLIYFQKSQLITQQIHNSAEAKIWVIMDQANEKTLRAIADREKAMALYQDMEAFLKKMEAKMKVVVVKFKQEK